MVAAQTKAIPAAQKSKSADVLEHLLASDFTAVGSNGKPLSRGELIGGARDGELQYYQIYDLKVVSLDPDAALVTYNIIVKEPEGDTPGLAPRYQCVTDAWVRQGGEWKLRFQQSTPLRSID